MILLRDKQVFISGAAADMGYIVWRGLLLRMVLVISNLITLPFAVNF